MAFLKRAIKLCVKLVVGLVLIGVVAAVTVVVWEILPSGPQRIVDEGAWKELSHLPSTSSAAIFWSAEYHVQKGGPSRLTLFYKYVVSTI